MPRPCPQFVARKKYAPVQGRLPKTLSMMVCQRAGLVSLLTLMACSGPEHPTTVMSHANPPADSSRGASLMAAVLASPSTTPLRFVAIDLAPLRGGTPELTIAIPGEVAVLQAILTDHYPLLGDEEGTLVWSGAITEVDGQPAEHGASAIFIITGKRVMAQLSFSRRTLEVLTTEEGGDYLLVERDFGQLPQDDDTPALTGDEQLLDAPAAEGRAAPGDENSTGGRALTGDAVVRVLQIASPEARQSLGGRAIMKDRLRFFLAQANLAFVNSGVGIRVANAGLRLPSESQQTQNADRLLTRLMRTADGRLYDHLAGGPDDGNGRNGTRADVVALATDELFAILPPPNIRRIHPAGKVHTVGGGAGRAFFVIRADATDHTWTHELGHLFGGRHQNDPTATPFAYAHAFRYLVPRGPFVFYPAYQPGDFKTIMGVGPDEEPRIPYFSSDTRRRRGMRIGDAGFRDNERLMRTRRQTMAAFR